MKAYQEWKSKHELSEIKIGAKIDVRDTEYIWCTGTIELKITAPNNPPLLFIHYEVISLFLIL